MTRTETEAAFLRYVEDVGFREGIDGLFARIEDPTQQFIERHSLPINKWQQDEPLWVIRWMYPDKLHRVIQIAAELGEVDTPTLGFLTYGYMHSPGIPTEREFTARIIIGHLDNVTLQENPNLTNSLLERSFRTANEIPSVW